MKYSVIESRQRTKMQTETNNPNVEKPALSSNTGFTGAICDLRRAAISKRVVARATINAIVNEMA